MQNVLERPRIHESLQSLAVSIADLQPDPANARKHGDLNLAAIRGSLAQFGQRRPVVVQRQGMIVRAGNGLLAAARQLGWTHVAALVVDEDDVSAVSFGIADNRTAELAEWDRTTLEKLLHTVEVGDPDLQQMFADLAADTGIIDPEAATPAASSGADSYQVLVTCSDERAQSELLAELDERGFTCRALIS